MEVFCAQCLDFGAVSSLLLLESLWAWCTISPEYSREREREGGREIEIIS